MGEPSSHPVMLDDETRQRLAERQATCPFVGSLVAEGVLMGDPTSPGAGRFDAEAFARLAALARDGWIRRTDVGHFIAANLDREPAVDLDDLVAMFRDKRLPEGWRNWKKARGDWVVHTTALLPAAAREYLSLRRARRRNG